MRKHFALACGITLSLVLAAADLAAQAASSVRGTEVAPGRTSQSDSLAVVAVVDRFHAAMSAGDSATVMALLAPDAIILESGGIETRSEYQSHHLPGDISYAKATKSARGPLRVSVRGDVAWVSSTSAVTGESRGRPVNSASAELLVLTRESGAWRVSAIHWSSRSQRPAGASAPPPTEPERLDD